MSESNVVTMPDRQMINNIPEDDLLTFREAMSFLKLKKRTLYYHVECGSIPFLKAGRLLRFSRRALLDWMARNAARQ